MQSSVVYLWRSRSFSILLSHYRSLWWWVVGTARENEEMNVTYALQKLPSLFILTVYWMELEIRIRIICPIQSQYDAKKIDTFFRWFHFFKIHSESFMQIISYSYSSNHASFFYAYGFNCIFFEFWNYDQTWVFPLFPFPSQIFVCFHFVTTTFSPSRSCSWWRRWINLYICIYKCEKGVCDKVSEWWKMYSEW